MNERFTDFFGALASILHLKHSDEEACAHMKTLLSDLSDDTSTGIARWYTERHIGGCVGCSKAVIALREQRRLLRIMGQSHSTETVLVLAEERRLLIEKEWDRMDAAMANGNIEEAR